MYKVNATDAKNKFGLLIDTAKREPVVIEKNGRPAAYVLSPEEYSKLSEIEDKYWEYRAIMAEKEGFLSEKRSKDFLDNLGK